MTRPIRVLVISPIFLPDYAGWLQQTLTMIQACNPEQVLFTWIYPCNDKKLPTDILSYLVVHCIGSLNNRSSRSGRLGFGMRVIDYLYRHRATYDVIYCPFSYMPTELVSAAARLIRKPVVVRIAQGEISGANLGGRIRRWLLPKLADAFIVLNQGHDISRKSIYWLPNGVDTTRFHPPTHDERLIARQYWKITQDVKMVLFVGSIVPRKGVNTLLEAFHLIQEQGPASILYLIGPTDSTEGGKSTQTEFVAKLQIFVKENGLTDNVRFVGHVSDVESVMHAADVFVLPSLAEGMPNVLLEAMASALPCIASDIPGIREVITNNADGCLFAPGDVKQLADKLLHLLCNPEMSIRLGHAGRKTIEEHYSIRKTAQNYQSIFQMLVSGTPHAT